MRYGPNISKQISEELRRVPIIRHVCAKFGIDHSTFYRWMGKHLSFRKEVLAALYFGREFISGTAESVIMRGIQNGEFRSAAYWLSHNEPRYMQKDKGDHYLRLLERDRGIMMEELPKDDLDFEKVFDMFYKMEKDGYDFEFVQGMTRPIVDLFCVEDKDLPDILYAAYIEWREEKKRTEKLTENFEFRFGRSKKSN